MAINKDIKSIYMAYVQNAVLNENAAPSQQPAAQQPAQPAAQPAVKPAQPAAQQPQTPKRVDPYEKMEKLIVLKSKLLASPNLDAEEKALLTELLAAAIKKIHSPGEREYEMPEGLSPEEEEKIIQDFLKQ